MGQDSFQIHVGVRQRTFERVAIYCVMERKDDETPIGVLHLDVTSAPVEFDEPLTLQSGEHLAARQQWPLHSANLTILGFRNISRVRFEVERDGLLFLG